MNLSICSISPHVDQTFVYVFVDLICPMCRFAFTVIWEMTHDAEIVNTSFMKSVILSKVRASDTHLKELVLVSNFCSHRFRFKFAFPVKFLTFYAPRKNSGEHIVAALSVRPFVSQSVSQSVRTSRIRVRPITLLFEVGFPNFHRNDHHSARVCRAQHLGLYLKGQGHSMILKQNSVRPITLLFEVGFPNCFSEMITIVRGCVARNIWVSTLKVKVTAWPWNKIVSGP